MFLILGIISYLSSTIHAIDLRIVNGSSPNEGRVEIRHSRGSDWSTVCGTFWDINDVIVACRQLGFPGAHASLKRSEFGKGPGAMSPTRLFCRGGENSLNACERGDSSICRGGLTAGAICQEPGYLGCYADSPQIRVLSDTFYTSRNMSVMRCIDYCRDRGYAYAGLEYGEECYCGNSGTNYSRLGRDWDAACQHPCTGYQNERCGGIGRIAVYMTNATAPSTTDPPQTTTLATTEAELLDLLTTAPSVDTTDIISSTSKVMHTKIKIEQTTQLTQTQTDGLHEKENHKLKDKKMKNFAVVMGILFAVGLTVSCCILAWNFKLRASMRELRSGRLSDRIRNMSKTKPNAKKPPLVYSDLLSTDVTDNHYETLITEDGTPALSRASKQRVPFEDEDEEVEETIDRYSNLPRRVAVVYDKSDVYENYRYSYMP